MCERRIGRRKSAKDISINRAAGERVCALRASDERAVPYTRVCVCACFLQFAFLCGKALACGSPTCAHCEGLIDVLCLVE